jgi:hypothetical protein
MYHSHLLPLYEDNVSSFLRFYLSVPDGKGLGQLACQEEWKKWKREEE